MEDKGKILVVGGLVIGALAYMATKTRKPLGLRNKNVGNVKGTGWKGQIGVDERGHGIFADEYYSARAMTIDVLGDIYNDGNNTIEGIVKEYTGVVGAPDASSLSDKREYVYYLCRRLGIPKTFALIFTQGATPTLIPATKIKDMLLAMMDFEQGTNVLAYVPYSKIIAGIRDGAAYIGLKPADIGA